MPRCAKCGKMRSGLTAFSEDYLTFGGPLQVPCGKKACARCRAKIASFLGKKVNRFKFVLGRNFSIHFKAPFIGNLKFCLLLNFCIEKRCPVRYDVNLEIILFRLALLSQSYNSAHRK